MHATHTLPSSRIHALVCYGGSMVMFILHVWSFAVNFPSPLRTLLIIKHFRPFYRVKHYEIYLSERRRDQYEPIKINTEVVTVQKRWKR